MDAGGHCHELGGRATTLVSIHSQEENDFVESLFSHKDGLNAWIGGYSTPPHCENNELYCKPWYWRDGSDFDYYNFARGSHWKPKSVNGIMMYGRSGSNPGKWINKDPNTQVTGFVCSHNLKEPSSK